MAGPDAPFAVPSSTQFMPLPPDANSKPNIVPGVNNGTKYSDCQQCNVV